MKRSFSTFTGLPPFWQHDDESGGREGERETERDRQRQTYRQRERQTQTDRQRERERERSDDTGMQTHQQSGTQTWKYELTGMLTNRKDTLPNYIGRKRNCHLILASGKFHMPRRHFAWTNKGMDVPADKTR